jgi:hypothetical protein
MYVKQIDVAFWKAWLKNYNNDKYIATIKNNYVYIYIYTYMYTKKEKST